MMICPHCGKSYSEDNLFCPEDGNTLVDVNEQETVVNRKVPFAAPPPGAQGYEDTVAFRPPVTPPHSQPAPRASAGNSILMAVIGGCVVLIGVLIYFLASGSPKPVTPQGGNQFSTVSPSPSPTAGSTVENKNPGYVEPVKTPPAVTEYRQQSLPDGAERTYQGTSYTQNGNLPLTLSLRRSGNNLTGSAQTPGDWDDLYGTIQPDGTFSLSGDNRLAGRVTGVWRGRIDANGAISGVWTSTSGKRVRFNAR